MACWHWRWASLSVLRRVWLALRCGLPSPAVRAPIALYSGPCGVPCACCRRRWASLSALGGVWLAFAARIAESCGASTHELLSSCCEGFPCRRAVVGPEAWCSRVLQCPVSGAPRRHWRGLTGEGQPFGAAAVGGAWCYREGRGGSGSLGGARPRSRSSSRRDPSYSRA